MKVIKKDKASYRAAFDFIFTFCLHINQALASMALAMVSLVITKCTTVGLDVEKARLLNLIKISMNGVRIQQTDSIKYHGVVIDNKLS